MAGCRRKVPKWPQDPPPLRPPAENRLKLRFWAVVQRLRFQRDRDKSEAKSSGETLPGAQPQTSDFALSLPSRHNGGFDPRSTEVNDRRPQVMVSHAKPCESNPPTGLVPVCTLWFIPAFLTLGSVHS